MEKINQSNATRANKGRKQVIFEPGDWVWTHEETDLFKFLSAMTMLTALIFLVSITSVLLLMLLIFLPLIFQIRGRILLRRGE
ncbi:hypothetical protein GQ457_12G014600 [Hibiscus cannabinus]